LNLAWRETKDRFVLRKKVAACGDGAILSRCAQRRPFRTERSQKPLGIQSVPCSRPSNRLDGRPIPLGIALRKRAARAGITAGGETPEYANVNVRESFLLKGRFRSLRLGKQRRYCADPGDYRGNHGNPSNPPKGDT
jgi:hypothetical protein